MKNTGFHLPKTIAQAEMRTINRSAVLEYFRLIKAASRTEISIQLGLSRPTVMRIIDDLIAEGLVFSTGEKEFGKGRSRELLSLNAKGNAIIGIDIGGSHISGALVNIGGEIILKNHVHLHWGGPIENFNRIVEFIQSLLDQSKQQSARLLGIGICVPGIVAAESGEIIVAPTLQWNNFPLLEKLKPLWDIPCFIENDVALAALGEHWFGAGVGVDNLIIIAIGTGIGAGIILDGRLYHGHNHASGEIGYILPNIQCLNKQYPDFGALESFASGKGITDRARELLKNSQPDIDLSTINALYVFEAGKKGESWATQIVDDTMDYLSLMIANVTSCFDPELIILGGGVAGSLDQLIDTITARLTGVVPKVPQLVTSDLDNNAQILGAVVNVFQRITGHSIVHIS
jgi:glucokinase